MDKENVNNVLKEIKDIDNNVTGVLVPILRDTVADYRKIVFKLILTIVFLIVGIIGVSISAQVIISQQIDKYNDFLSQFDFEMEGETTITQDLDTGEGGNISNSTINANK